MKTKRLHQRLTSTNSQQLLTLPVVMLILLASLSGCSTSSSSEPQVNQPVPTVDRHSQKSEKTPGQTRPDLKSGGQFVPYAVPVIRTNPGVKATASSNVRRCPYGTLRYCDHRKNRCACVVAADTYRALDLSRTGF